MQTLDTGSITVIFGPMFSGKTSDLLRRITLERELGLKVCYINHASDTRTTSGFSTHNPLYKKQFAEGSGVDTYMSSSLKSIFGDLIKYNVIFIDESQFFPDLVEVVLDLCENHKKKVVAVGLITDFERKKFGHLHDLILYADKIVSLRSYCKECRSNLRRSKAIFSHLSVASPKVEKDIESNTSETNVIIGGAEIYEPLCRACYLMKNH